MIKNTQLTDLGAVSAEFPYGFPKNESSAGANDGTLLNSDYLNDMFQLFQRAVALSGITPNELLDNATNGYQLFDAMKMVMSGVGKQYTYVEGIDIIPSTLPLDGAIFEFTRTTQDTALFALPSAALKKGQYITIYCTGDYRNIGSEGARLGLANDEDEFHLSQDTANSISPFGSTYFRGGRFWSDGTRWHVISVTSNYGFACPFVYINGVYVDEIIKNQVGCAMNRVDSVDITKSVIVGLNTFKLTEEKDEISYLEYVSLYVDGIKVKTFDVDIVMNKGDEKEWSFEISDGYKSARIEAKGYYDRL